MPNNFKHGKRFEVFVIEALCPGLDWRLVPATAVWDIPAEYDRHGISTSIKSFGKNTIYLSDAVRFFSHENDYRLVAVPYSQIGVCKKASIVYEFDMKPELMQANVFQKLQLENVQELSNLMRDNAHEPREELRKTVFEARDSLAKTHNSLIHLDPKIDHENQRRLQCSIQLADLCAAMEGHFKTYDRDFYGYVLPWEIDSPPRNYRFRQLNRATKSRHIISFSDCVELA